MPKIFCHAKNQGQQRHSRFTSITAKKKLKTILTVKQMCMPSQSGQPLLSDRHDECSLCYVLEYRDWRRCPHVVYQVPCNKHNEPVLSNAIYHCRLISNKKITKTIWTFQPCILFHFPVWIQYLYNNSGWKYWCHNDRSNQGRGAMWKSCTLTIKPRLNKHT